MTQYLTNRKTNERYPINGCIVNPNAPEPLSTRAFHIVVSQQTLPRRVSLKGYISPVKNQGKTNSGVAHAVSCACEYLVRKEGSGELDFSRLFIYYNARVKWFGENCTIKDTGVPLDIGFRAIKQYGVCKEVLWSFDSHRVNQRPPKEAYQNGLKYSAPQISELEIDLYAMKLCLARGYPFTFGLKTFASFGQAWHNGGHVPMPGPRDQLNSKHGHHAMLAVGYNDHRQEFTVKNSWGTNWGHAGYCYIPYGYLANRNYCHAAIVIKQMTMDTSEAANNSGTAWFCDSCGEKEYVLTKPRYHCRQCPDFDLCETCYNTQKEPKQHYRTHKMQQLSVQKLRHMPNIEVITTPGDQIQGIHRTLTGQDSSKSQPRVHYPPDENPSNAIDRNLNTKYLNFGNDRNGLNTGFYVTPQKGRSVVTQIQFTTANDAPEQDPIDFILEGSNSSATQLNQGSSWVGICHGETGLKKDPGRLQPGPALNINNSKVYRSYRVLIQGTRDQTATCVHYSGCILFGKILEGSTATTRGLPDHTGDDDDDDEENAQIGWDVDDEIPNMVTTRGTRDVVDDDWCIETDDTN